jgi:ABC-2 type transport system permease protein
MNGRAIAALVAKDVALFFRNRFFAFVSVLGLVAYAGLFFAMPSAVDETLSMGLVAPALPPLLAQQVEQEGLTIQLVDSEVALREAVSQDDVPVGVVLPEDIFEAIAQGNQAKVKVYFTRDVPQQIQEAYTILLQELAFLFGGQPLNVQVSEEILGRDMAGMQVPMRDRMLPLMAVFVLMVETMGLASLITAEIETDTIQALLVTPLRIDGLFASKGLMGVGMAFVQAGLLMAVTGGLRHQPVLMLVTLLLGALLVTGFGFLIASLARDMMSVMSWGLLCLLVLSVPAFGAMFPGAVTGWTQLIPSHYLVDTVNQVANYHAGWGDVGGSLLILLAWSMALVGLGMVVLARRFR